MFPVKVASKVVAGVVGGVLAVLAQGSLQAASADEAGCKPFKRNYGPFDYRSISYQSLELVESFHFYPEVEQLRYGARNVEGSNATLGSVAADIAYTLRAIPNHRRALSALSRLSLQLKSDRIVGLGNYVDCFFKEAIRMYGDDGVSYRLYAGHLLGKGKVTESLDYYQKALALGDDTPNFHYNHGLALLEAKQYPQALQAAHLAYAAGFPFPGLRDRLKRAGHWKDLPPTTAAPAAPAANAEPAAPANAATSSEAQPAAKP